MKSTTRYVVWAILVTAIAAGVALIGIGMGEPHSYQIGPNMVQPIQIESKVTIMTGVTFRGENFFELENIQTGEKINADRILPAMGEENAHFVIVNPSVGTYRISSQVVTIDVYSETPSSITVVRVGLSLILEIVMFCLVGLLSIIAVTRTLITG